MADDSRATRSDPTPVTSLYAIDQRLQSIERTAREAKDLAAGCSQKIDDHAGRDEKALSGINDSIQGVNKRLDTFNQNMVDKLVEALAVKSNAEVTVQAKRAESVIEETSAKRAFLWSLLTKIGIGIAALAISIGTLLVEHC